MPIQKNTTNGVLTRYESKYREGVRRKRLYDQLASPMKETFEPRGTTIQAAMTTDMIPRPDAALGDMENDFEPQVIDDAVADLHLYWRNDGLKTHQQVPMTHFDSMAGIFARKVGENMSETVDGLARRAATEGDICLWPLSAAGGHSTRATLDLATAGDYVDDEVFNRVGIMVEALLTNQMIDGTMIAICDPWAYASILKNGTLVSVAQYTEYGKKYIQQGEVGMINNFRILKSPFAKTLWGAGAARAVPFASTSAADVKPGDKTIESVGAVAALAVGQWLNVGDPLTEGASSTDLLDRTEGVYINKIDAATKVVTISGTGPFGGFRFPHPAGTTITNKSSVHTIVFGGPNSLAKAYSKQLGEYGQLVRPFETGNAKQWTVWAWKWFGGYGRLAESWIIRCESAHKDC